MKIDIDGAVEFFNTHEYLVINSSRMSGKTTTLKRIIESNPYLKIGIKTPTLKMFDWNYKQYKNCTYIQKYTVEYCFDLIIGDEVLVEPRRDQKTACAYTKKYVECSLSSQLDIDSLDRIAYDYPKQFEIQFGQYLE
ncbi:hypothetical protein KAR91_59590 [Candidatus Pacearchaeota archaeon]|nr:hypothetical protein [Candidatus Pacearchaeota archaeon]